MAIDRDMLLSLRADPTPERYMVVADYLQTQGDPRGELIALDTHARVTGTKRDPRADEIESRLRHELFDPPFGSGTMWMMWERGFLRELTIPSGYIPEIRKRGWFEADDLVLLRSLSIADQHGTVDDAQPIELLTTSPLQFSLEHLAIGSARGPLVDADRLLALFAAIGPLTRIELQANHELDHDRLRALEQIDRLEALSLWAPGDHALLDRLIAAPWPALRALTLTASGPTNSDLTPSLHRLLDGACHPTLTELAVFASGFEHALIRALGARPQRLARLGLGWHEVDERELGDVRDELEGVELIWPRPPGVPLSAADEWGFARRLRGLERNRDAFAHAKRACFDERAHHHWIEAGELADLVDDPAAALEAMERAIALRPRDHLGWYGAGQALRKLGRYEESREMLRRGLARLPTSVELYVAMADTFVCEGRVDDAIECHTLALEHQDFDGGRLFHLTSIAALALDDGRIEVARDHVDRGRVLDPDNTRLAVTDGYLRLALGRPDEALSLGNQLADHADDDDDLTSIQVLRAMSLLALDQPDEAAAVYRRIVQGADCPAIVAFAWLGLAILGEDPFAPFASLLEPPALAEAITAHVNATRRSVQVHDTTDRTDDRINCALAAVGGAICAGRLDEAAARHAALLAYLRGPSPVKYAERWIESGALLRALGQRADVALLVDAVRIASGGAMLRPPTSSELVDGLDGKRGPS